MRGAGRWNPAYSWAMKEPQTYVFPLRWSLSICPAFDTHWTQRLKADRLTREQAREVLRRLAPTLTVPIGHVVDVECVFIPPNRRKLSEVRMREQVCAVRSGLADALGCEVWRLYCEHRVAKVFTPRGELLVKVTVVPIKGWCVEP